MATATETIHSSGGLDLECAGTLQLGTTTGSGVTIGRPGQTTTVQGSTLQAPETYFSDGIHIDGDAAVDGAVTAVSLQTASTAGVPSIKFASHTTSGFGFDTESGTVATFHAGAITGLALRAYELTNEEAMTVFQVDLVFGDFFSFIINYGVRAANGGNTNMQGRTGVAKVNMYRPDDADAVCQVNDDGFTTCSSGLTLTSAWSSIIDGGQVTLQFTGTSGLIDPNMQLNINLVIPRAPAHSVITWA